jgi:hypothetical protein
MADDLRFNIPLSSPLEVTSEDTVVNAENPTFLSNTQEEMAGLLTNSIKYEREGYFLGWNSYTFRTGITGNVSTNPDDLGDIMVADMGDDIFSVSYMQGPSFSVAYGAGGIVEQIIGSAAYSRSGSTWRFTGQTAIETPYTAVIDTKTFNIVSMSLPKNENVLTKSRPYAFSSSRIPDDKDKFDIRNYSFSKSDLPLSILAFSATGSGETFELTGGARITIPNTLGNWSVSGAQASFSGATRTYPNTKDELDEANIRITEDKVTEAGIQTEAKDWAFRTAVGIGRAEAIVNKPVLGDRISYIVDQSFPGPYVNKPPYSDLAGPDRPQGVVRIRMDKKDGVGAILRFFLNASPPNYEWGDGKYDVWPGICLASVLEFSSAKETGEDIPRNGFVWGSTKTSCSNPLPLPLKFPGMPDPPTYPAELKRYRGDTDNLFTMLDLLSNTIWKNQGDWEYGDYVIMKNCSDDPPPYQSRFWVLSPSTDPKYPSTFLRKDYDDRLNPRWNAGVGAYFSDLVVGVHKMIKLEDKEFSTDDSIQYFDSQGKLTAQANFTVKTQFQSFSGFITWQHVYRDYFPGGNYYRQFTSELWYVDETDDERGVRMTGGKTTIHLYDYTGDYLSPDPGPDEKARFPYAVLSNPEGNDKEAVDGEIWFKQPQRSMIIAKCTNFFENTWEFETETVPGFSPISNLTTGDAIAINGDCPSRIPNKPADSRHFNFSFSFTMLKDDDMSRGDMKYGWWRDKVVAVDQAETKLRVDYSVKTTTYEIAASSTMTKSSIQSNIDKTWNITDFNATPMYYYPENKYDESVEPRQDVSFKIKRGEFGAKVSFSVDPRNLRKDNYVIGTPSIVKDDDSAAWQVNLKSFTVKKSSKGNTTNSQGLLEFVFTDNTMYRAAFKRFIVWGGSGLASGARLVSASNGIARLSFSQYSDVPFSIDDELRITDLKAKIYVARTEGTTYFIAPNDNVSFTFLPGGTFYDNEVTNTSVSGRTVSFTYNGVSHTVSISKGSKSLLQLHEQNMRKPLDPPKLIRSMDSIGRLVLRSAWADSEVETYFYADENNIMVVRYDSIELLRKTPEYDVEQTWKWEVIASVPRDTWILDEFPRWGMSSGIDGNPVFWRLKGNSMSLSIELCAAPNTVQRLQNPNFSRSEVPIRHLSYDSPPDTDSICMWEPFFDGETLAAQARITAACVNGKFMMGIWAGKSLKQWGVFYSSLSSIQGVLLGYGLVGPSGTLTGGQLPAYACSQWGFRQPIKALSKAALDEFGTYGAGDSVYFYQGSDSSGIIGHYSPASSGWTPVTIGLRSQHKKQAYNDGGNKVGISPVIQLIFLMPAVGIMEVVSNWASAYAYSAMSTWLTRNAGSDVDAFIESASQVTSSTFESASTMIAYGMSAVGAVAGYLTNDGIVPASVTDMALDALSMALGVDSYYKTKAGPWSYKISLADCYSIGNDSSVFAGPGFVQHQFVQSHWIGGGSGTEIRAASKGFLVAPPLTIPGIQALGSGLGSALELMNGLSGVYPADIGPNGESREMRIPAGRLGFRHLYLNYPSLAPPSTINQSLLSATTKRESVGLSYPSAITINNPSAPYFVITPEVTDAPVRIPAGYSVIDGCDNVLERADFLGVKRVEYPEFSDPFVYDYLVHDTTGLWYSAVDGEVVYTSVDDTKILDGEPSNVVTVGQKLLVASSYAALEVLPKGGFDLKLLRPRPVTSSVLMWNTTERNIFYNGEVKHGFDAYSNRILSLHGAPGLDVEQLHTFYSFYTQGPLKAASIFPPAALFGLFTSPPQVKYASGDWSWPVDMILQNQITQKNVFATLGSKAENKNGYRFSIPVTHDRLALLPAAIKTIAAYKLNVVDGITSLTTDIRSTNGILRRPKALDFTVYGQIYRWNEEYVSKINNAFGTSDVRDIVATLGLTYTGSTPEVAWFYSPAIRGFYNFTGSETLRKLFSAFRMYDVRMSTWDFVEQEVVLEAETNHGTMLARASSYFTGEVYPVAGEVGPYDFYSMAGGLTFQGLNRHQVNRFLLLEEMIDSIKLNRGKWKKVKGNSIDDFWSFRERVKPVEGYFYEPLRAATSYLGVSDTVECMYEWHVNFALTDLVARIWEDKFIKVYLAAETITVGGVVRSPVTTIRLRRDMFTRSGQHGYYSFRFTGNNGAGDSERLYIWSDDIVSIRSIEQVCKPVTQERTAPLLTAPDFAQDEEY